MLPAPSPPTDNLYKFMAIAGLVIAGAGVIYPQLLKERMEADRQKFITEIDAIRHDLDDFGRATKAAPHEIGPDGKVYYDMTGAWPELDKVNDRMPALEAAHRTWGAKMDALRWWRWICYSAAVAGAFVSAFGFWLWRTRLQRFQDELLRQQLNAGAGKPPADRGSSE
jgi:hypothetical protein